MVNIGDILIVITLGFAAFCVYTLVKIIRDEWDIYKTDKNYRDNFIDGKGWRDEQ